MGKHYNSRELKDLTEADGWILVSTEGSHHQYKHPSKKGRVTLPHPKKDLPTGTINSVLKQAGLKGRPAERPAAEEPAQDSTKPARKENEP